MISSEREIPSDVSGTKSILLIHDLVVDSFYTYLLRSEFYWPVIFGLGYASMEPDVILS